MYNKEDRAEVTLGILMKISHRIHLQCVTKKSVILEMMKASIVGPTGAIWCTVGTQKTCPIGPRHALRIYFTFFVSLQ